MDKQNTQFDVALSFAGEDRDYVEKVASVLKAMGIRVFYDKYETVSLWGKDLYVHLREVYFQHSKYTVIFLSEHYKEKLWTNHERESAQARAFTENREYVLPARFDDTQIPGILPTTGYVSLSDYSPEQFAELIKQKVGPVNRTEFFPDYPDRLYEYLEASEEEEDLISLIAYSFFTKLKLMTPKERHILATACGNACPAGLPDDVHLRIDYLARVSGVSRDELVAIFSRLDCLDIKSRLYESDSHEDEHSLGRASEIIELTYEPLLIDFDENATPIMTAMFDCISDQACPTCVQNAIERVDFSLLGTLTGFEEIH